MDRKNVPAEQLTERYRQEKLQEFSKLGKHTALRDVPVINRKKPFWPRVWNFLRGRSNAGRVFHAAAAAGAGIAAGINIEPLLTILQGGTETMDLNWIELVLMAVTGLIGFLISRQLVKGLLQELLEEVRDIVTVASQARQTDSPAGKDLSDEEKKMIRKELDDLILVLYNRLLRSRIARLFGIDSK